MQKMSHQNAVHEPLGPKVVPKRAGGIRHFDEGILDYPRPVGHSAMVLADNAQPSPKWGAVHSCAQRPMLCWANGG